MKQRLSVELHEVNNAFLVRPILVETNPDETHEPPHRHDYQEILWIRSGQGKHVIDGQVFPFQPQTIYLIARGEVHQLVTGVDVDGLVIRFTDDFLSNRHTLQMGSYQTVLFNNVTINHALPIRDEELGRFEALLQQIRQEYALREEKGQVVILRHLLMVLLLKLEQGQRRLVQEEPTAVGEEAQQFYHFITLLEAQFTQTHTVQDYARILNITPRQLSVITQRFLGKNAKHVIDDRLILEARRDLAFTNLSVKEITHALGFKDPAYFSKMFKKQAGMTPQGYKNSL